MRQTTNPSDAAAHHATRNPQLATRNPQQKVKNQFFLNFSTTLLL